MDTQGVIPDLAEEIRKGKDRLKDEAAKAIDRMREALAEARRRRMLRLAAVFAAGYLLWRWRRR